jgi:hypothetical protein
MNIDCDGVDFKCPYDLQDSNLIVTEGILQVNRRPTLEHWTQGLFRGL